MTVTGERVETKSGGFNPTWQRHLACYAEAANFLGPGRVLDLGCGIGHAYHLLAPRESVGVDLDPGALAGQDRQTRVADMRSLPFADESFASVVSVHSIEHVPDAHPALAEMERVMQAGGTAVVETPNRLTFGRPDEVIDPYHFVEYDARELGELCRRFFSHVDVYGLFGSPRYLEIHVRERRKLSLLLACDPLRVRRVVPRRVRQRLYDFMLTRARMGSDPATEAIAMSDFTLGEEGLDECIDLVAVCRKAGAKG